jgi:pilus assembly protein CpaF
MVLMSGFDLPVRAIREQVASALDVMVQLTRLRDGSRRVEQVCEVEGMESGTIVTSELFRFETHAHGASDAGSPRRALVSTGVRPRFTQRMSDLGIELSAGIFEPPPVQGNGSR